MDNRNPLLAKATVFGDRDRAQHSTCGEPPPQRKPPSAKTRKLIGQLGTRYRPSAQADLEEYAASLALLACDVADVPEFYLEQAIINWVRESPFMPKASDLISLAQSLVQNPGKGDKIDFATPWNADLRARGITHMRWIDDNGQMKLESA